jgi:hypothetical protein
VLFLFWRKLRPILIDVLLIFGVLIVAASLAYVHPTLGGVALGVACILGAFALTRRQS